MQCLGTDTGFLGPWWGKEEQTEPVNVPLMTRTEVFYNFGILASEGNPVSNVQASVNRNISSTLIGQ